MNTPVRWDEPTAKALAHAIAKLRPAWDSPGILGAIHAAYGRHHDLATVAHIAIDAATDPTAATPGVIAVRDRTAPASVTPPPSRPRETGHTCRRCGRIHVAATDPSCPVPASEDRIRRGMTAVRQALADARQEPA